MKEEQNIAELREIGTKTLVSKFLFSKKKI